MHLYTLMPDTGGGSSSACLVLAPPIGYQGILKANLVAAKRRKSIDEHAPASNRYIGGKIKRKMHCSVHRRYRCGGQSALHVEPDGQNTYQS